MSSDKRVMTRASDPISSVGSLLMRMGTDPIAKAPCTSSGARDRGQGPRRGIPGFPLEAVAVALITTHFMLRRTREL